MAPETDVALIEWPDGREAGGPRLLGRTTDPDLIKAVRERIARDHRRALAKLRPPVRAVPPTDSDPEEAA